MASVETEAPPLWQRETMHVIFRLAGAEYGFPIVRVQEIVQWMEVTRVPRVADFVLGVVNLHGKVVPVIDLRARFKLPPAPMTPRTCIIVLQVSREAGMSVGGVVADEVVEVVDVTADQIEPPPGIGARVNAGFIAGKFHAGNWEVLLLSAERLLDNRGWTLVERVLEEKEQAHE